MSACNLEDSFVKGINIVALSYINGRTSIVHNQHWMREIVKTGPHRGCVLGLDKKLYHLICDKWEVPMVSYIC